jgi:hypothetical protein
VPTKQYEIQNESHDEIKASRVGGTGASKAVDSLDANRRHIAHKEKKKGVLTAMPYFVTRCRGPARLNLEGVFTTTVLQGKLQTCLEKAR